MYDKAVCAAGARRVARQAPDSSALTRTGLSPLTLRTKKLVRGSGGPPLPLPHCGPATLSRVPHTLTHTHSVPFLFPKFLGLVRFQTLVDTPHSFRCFHYTDIKIRTHFSSFNTTYGTLQGVPNVILRLTLDCIPTLTLHTT